MLFELEGLARVFVGSSGLLPDEGFPYSEIFRKWNQRAGEAVDGQITGNPKAQNRAMPLAETLAASFMTLTRKPPAPGKPQFDGLVAVNLDTLDEAARVLDMLALALALLHSIGDWHVLDAIKKAISRVELEQHRVSIVEPTSTGSTTALAPRQSSRGAAATRASTQALDDIEFLPAIDLFALLDAIEDAFGNKLDHDESQSPDDTKSRPHSSKDDRNDCGEWLQRPRSGGQVNRALLFVHGTFSKCAPTLVEFAKTLSGDAAGEENLFN
ncbi:MAG: hypothetical protein NTZ32_01940 [Planctomycetales bacterium]|nr:hypothetical protein [Planctomycetales bacterium]